MLRFHRFCVSVAAEHPEHSVSPLHSEAAERPSVLTMFLLCL